MFLGHDVVDIPERERQERLNALDLANCPDSLQGLADYLDRQADMRVQMTPEKRSVKDAWQKSVRKDSSGSGEEDTMVTESPVPSVYSDAQDDNVEVAAGPSSVGNKVDVAFVMSCPMPMGPYRAGKHTTTVVSTVGVATRTGHDDDDDGWCTSCMGGLLGCWNYFWWTCGCTFFMCGRPSPG